MNVFEKIEDLLGPNTRVKDFQEEIDCLIVEYVIITEPFQKWDDTNLEERFAAIGLILNSYWSIPETDFTPIGPSPTAHQIHLAFEYPVQFYGY